ncbi:MAG: hypothetical protein K0S51_2238 [Bacillales bacterium]|jgi:CRISPR/Cas system CMR subunit Cmr4 (Cas7 group RAMP superfamily)|nr:hypothetical protein [Bacillales bacterium]
MRNVLLIISLLVVLTGCTSNRYVYKGTGKNWEFTHLVSLNENKLQKQTTVHYKGNKSLSSFEKVHVKVFDESGLIVGIFSGDTLKNKDDILVLNSYLHENDLEREKSIKIVIVSDEKIEKIYSK